MQTTLYCLACRRLVPHWRRWFRFIGWHYVCTACELRELQEYERLAQKEEQSA